MKHRLPDGEPGPEGGPAPGPIFLVPTMGQALCIGMGDKT